MKKSINRTISLLLTLVMLVGLLPALTTKATAMGASEVYVGYGRIGNSVHGATNLVSNFNIGTPGFYYTNNGMKVDRGEYVYGETKADKATLQIKVADNPTLKRIAKGGQGYIQISGHTQHNKEDIAVVADDHEYGFISINFTSHIAYEKAYGHQADAEVYFDTGDVLLKEDTVITLGTWIEEKGGEAPGPTGVWLYIYVKDTVCPTARYELGQTNTRTVYNANTKRSEMLLGLGTKYTEANNTSASRMYPDFAYNDNIEGSQSQYLDLKVTFTEEVRSSLATSVPTSLPEYTTANNAKTKMNNYFNGELKSAADAYLEAIQDPEYNNKIAQYTAAQDAYAQAAAANAAADGIRARINGVIAVVDAAETDTLRADDPAVEPPVEGSLEDPTEDPTEEPTEDPTEEPTEDPTEEPTEDPTEEPTEKSPEELLVDAAEAAVADVTVKAQAARQAIEDAAAIQGATRDSVKKAAQGLLIAEPVTCGDVAVNTMANIILEKLKVGMLFDVAAAAAQDDEAAMIAAAQAVCDAVTTRAGAEEATVETIKAARADIRAEAIKAAAQSCTKKLEEIPTDEELAALAKKNNDIDIANFVRQATANAVAAVIADPPAAEETTPVGEETTPAAEGGTPAAEGGTPAAEGETPAADPLAEEKKAFDTAVASVKAAANSMSTEAETAYMAVETAANAQDATLASVKEALEALIAAEKSDIAKRVEQTAFSVAGAVAEETALSDALASIKTAAQKVKDCITAAVEEVDAAIDAAAAEQGATLASVKEAMEALIEERVEIPTGEEIARRKASNAASEVVNAVAGAVAEAGQGADIAALMAAAVTELTNKAAAAGLEAIDADIKKLESQIETVPAEEKAVLQAEITQQKALKTAIQDVVTAIETGGLAAGKTKADSKVVTNEKVNSTFAIYQTAQNKYKELYEDYTAKQQVAEETALKALLISGGGPLVDLTKHYLFTNTFGTGYIGSGQVRGLELYMAYNEKTYERYVTQARSYASGGTVLTAPVNVAAQYFTELHYRYTTRRGDFSGNNKIPAGGGLDSATVLNEKSDGTGTISFTNRISESGLCDAAGNPVQWNYSSNPFTAYDVIVDAEPPTYSRVGNGITPEVLTGMVLNKNDTVDFTVEFSEAVIARRELEENEVTTPLKDEDTYLLLNNNAVADFVKKSADGKQWTFRYTIKDKDGGEVETPLWKVTALTNTALLSKEDAQLGRYVNQKILNDDARTITDYVGNMLADRANKSPNDGEATNPQMVNSNTAWAELAVDNTAPELNFRYEQYSAALTPSDANQWGQAGRIAVNATDANIIMPEHDPKEAGVSKYSKGIYRPQNMTGGTAEGSPAGGLIFYTWTQDETAPDVGTNFEAIKRYSLTGAQPKTVTDKAYAAAWNNYTLLMSNNSASIVPPNTAMTGGTDGAWYLHVWTADMTWDSARQIMQYDLMSGLKYNPGYDQAAYNKERLRATEKYRADTAWRTNADDTEAPPEYERHTFDEAWEEVKDEVYTAAYTEIFRGWLEESGKDVYSADAMTYADTRAMTVVGGYAETKAAVNGVETDTWTLDKFARDDSNWVSGTTRILFDDGKPTAAFDKENIIGDDTAVVNVPFSVADAVSGVDADKVWYQWIKKDGETAPTAASWKDVNQIAATATPEQPTGLMTGAPKATATATTLNNVLDGGEYYLLVKVTDKAGNSSVTVSDFKVKVNFSRTALCEFGGVSVGYVKSAAPTAHVTGVKIKEVYCVQSTSIETPAKWGSALTAQPAAEGIVNTESEKTYALPALDAGKTDGTWYVHIKVVENTANSKSYFFRQAYALDNTAPQVYFNNNGSTLPKERYEVTVSATDALSGMDKTHYQWLSYQDGTPDPAQESEGWTPLPAGGAVTLSDQAAGTYKLYVMAADKAGNVKIFATSGTFEFSPAAQELLPGYGSNLLHVYEENGAVYGVASLHLENEDKTGYRYSLSTDGGASWCSWLPYMSFIKLELPIASADNAAVNTLKDGQLRVAFRAPRGTVVMGEDGTLAGEPIRTETAAYANAGPYATAEFDSMRARMDGTPLTLLMSKPEDVTITPIGEENQATLTEEGNFTVSKNGVYSFTLTKENQSNETMTVVVDIYDNDAPKGNVIYSNAMPTNEPVIATLETGEAVRVTSAGGRSHVFTDNGTFIFKFEDEAGNQSTVTASVSNIDREAPKVKITSSYIYGAQGEKKFATLGAGSGLAARGVVLTVEKETPTGKDFTVVSGNQSRSVNVTQNGTYSFTVADAMGNTATVSKTVDYIINAFPSYTVDYDFVDMIDEAKTVNGILCAKADVKVTVKIPAAEVKGTGNAVYVGAQKVETTDAAGNAQGNKVGKETIDGVEYYVYTKTYTANGETEIVLCDGLGNVARIPVSVRGIDWNAPTLTLNKPSLSINQNTVITNNADAQTGFAAVLGGYAVTDNLSMAENITVKLKSELDTSRVGRKRVTYVATDELGNRALVEQIVYVLPADGLLVLADGTLLSGSAEDSAILPDNKVTFTIDEERMQAMRVRGATAQNKAMRYDLCYVTGLYREGQLKYIAKQLTSEELMERQFSFTFDQPGWYTIIIRNQERTREYTMFFISALTAD